MIWKFVLGATFLAAILSPRLSAQSSDPDAKLNLFTFEECEEGSPCGTWTFLGDAGTGQWSGGAVGNLVFTKFVNNPDKTATVVIRRTDSSGKDRGLRREYWGTLSNGLLSGQYGAPGQPGKPSGVWYAFPIQNRQDLPTTMHFCDQEHCATLLLDDGKYVVQMPNNCCSSSSVWTVHEFSLDRITMDRRDASGFTSFYTAPISSSGDVTLSGDSGPGAYAGDDAVVQVMHGNFRFTWGADLNSIRGDGEGIKAFTPPQQQSQAPGGMSPEETIQVLKFFTAVANAVGRNDN